MAQDVIVPDIVAFIMFGILAGGVLGALFAFAFRWTAFFWVGLFSGIPTGMIIHWLTRARQMPDPTPITAPVAPSVPSDLQHVVNSFERIFQTWAHHSSFTDACFFGAIVVIAIMIVKVTRISIEARQPPYYDQRYHDLRYPPPLPPGLERYYQPRQLEDHRPPEEQARRNLPAVRDDARTI